MRHSLHEYGLIYFPVSASLPWQPLLGIWRSRWAEHEFKIKLKDQLSTVGFRYRLVRGSRSCDCHVITVAGQVVWEGKEERRSEYVMVSEVLECSLAASAGVRMVRFSCSFPMMSSLHNLG